ncbi:TonB family protein [bacterium]|nr:TonB family protein [bacterium]
MAPTTTQPPRKRKPRALAPTVPALALAGATPTPRTWLASLGAHALILLLLAWAVGAERPIEPPSQPIELVDVVTDGPVGDTKGPASDRPTAKDVAQRVLPDAPVERHADRKVPVEAPRKAPTSQAPAPKAPVPKQVQPRPDYDALLAQREAKDRAREASRLGSLASAAENSLASDGGEDSTAESPHRGGSVDSGTGLTGDLGQRRIIEQHPPSYPASAQRLGVEGDVRLRVWVSAEGRVSRVEVVRLSGTPEMDRRAVDALKRWRFAPLPDGAAPVTQWGEITLRFRLD